jgi:hypothetical protein
MTTGQAVGAVSREAAEWYALKRAVRTVVHVGRRQSHIAQRRSFERAAQNPDGNYRIASRSRAKLQDRNNGLRPVSFFSVLASRRFDLTIQGTHTILL